MATDDQQVLVTGQAPAPAQHTIPGNGQIRPKAVYAKFTGTNTGTQYTPALKITSDGGELIGIYTACAPIAAGGSANVSWFPDVDCCCGQVQSGGSGTITSVTSPQGSLAVGNPTGPAVTADLPPSGVTAGTYGDSAHVSQVTVNADGVVTSASSVGITGLGGGMVNLFDQTLGGSAASIDTGANGVPAGYSALMVVAIGRAAGAFFSGSFNLVFNNDAGANYQFIWTDNSGGVSSSFASLNQNAIKMMEGPGASIGAGIFGVAHVTIPGYTQTTANKAMTSLGGFADTSGTHSELVHLVGTWNNTAAITRITFNTGIGNLIAGSRLTIYGLP